MCVCELQFNLIRLIHLRMTHFDNACKLSMLTFKCTIQIAEVKFASQNLCLRLNYVPIWELSNFHMQIK